MFTFQAVIPGLPSCPGEPGLPGGPISPKVVHIINVSLFHPRAIRMSEFEIMLSYHVVQLVLEVPFDLAFLKILYL